MYAIHCNRKCEIDTLSRLLITHQCAHLKRHNPMGTVPKEYFYESTLFFCNDLGAYASLLRTVNRRGEADLRPRGSRGEAFSTASVTTGGNVEPPSSIMCLSMGTSQTSGTWQKLHGTQATHPACMAGPLGVGV